MLILLAILAIALAGVGILLTTYYEDRKLKKIHRENNVRELNRLHKCLNCDKYFRTYQLRSIEVVRGTSVDCPHCLHYHSKMLGSRDVDVTGEMEDLGEFLKYHPECPILEGKRIVEDFQDTLDAIIKAKQNSISQREINRITSSYRKTGNKYYENLIQRKD